MKVLFKLQSRPLLCASAGVVTLLSAIVATPAAAQASDAAERCTPDVMRLCSEFVPDADRIVVCLKQKRRQLTPACLNALQPPDRGKKSLRRTER